MSGSDFRSPYAHYDVLEKRDSPSWNDQTREVVSRRLGEPPKRRFLTEAEWNLLEAVVARLLPQADRADPVPITPWIDEMLAANRGPGYRYSDMPPMREAWRQGLAAIAAEAQARHGSSFEDLASSRQDEVLSDIQAGRTQGSGWAGLSSRAFFSRLLLKTAVTTYYSHPAAWSEIGFGGPASPRGYVRLGFDERDPWEAEERRD